MTSTKAERLHPLIKYMKHWQSFNSVARTSFNDFQVRLLLYLTVGVMAIHLVSIWA